MVTTHSKIQGKKNTLNNHINNINAKATNTYPCINWPKKKKSITIWPSDCHLTVF